MITKLEIRTKEAPDPAGSYSQGIRIGNMIFTAGQIGKVSSTGKLPDGIEAQTRQTLMNIESILAGGGASLDDVVKVTVHLSNFDDFDKFDEIYRTFFTGIRPARTTVQSELGGVLIEIDVMAVVA